MIESLFIKANTKAGFQTQLQAGNIQNNQIAFIIDSKEIWTQGTYFSCPYTKEQIDALINAANASFIAEVNRATAAEADLQVQIDSLIGTGGSIDDRIQAAIDAVVNGAPGAFDTLKEIADWIQNDQSGAAKMAADIANKVDKVSGKGLSTNDYTDAEQTKLSGIETGAQVNVKPDWNAASGSATEILNKPTIPAAQVQSDWNETDQSSKAYIQNKPSIPDDLADLNEDTAHRVVTDTEKAAWNDKVKGLANGTTEDHVVVFGADGYTIKDSGHILGWNTLAN